MSEENLEVQRCFTDLLIVGGGTAGCFAAAKLGKSGLSVLIAEKANIERSGCLAAGVNALNAYIAPGHTPMDYVKYAEKDGEGIVRDDLVLTIAENVNRITAELEALGLVILKDEAGNYVTRGWRNVKINGENIKPILAKAAREQENVKVLNYVNIIDLKTVGNGDERRVIGAWGFSTRERIFYDISAKAVLIATGGAAGLYRPNNPGFSRHKMWYSPFNTGAGFAMGIRAGAEMTTFENRFVALRCKDTIAPTGTIAQGVGAKQVNAKGEVYETKYGISTPERIFGTVEENRAGHGPCYLHTEGIGAEKESDLLRAYLNMAPAQTLKWMEEDGPDAHDVEIEGTEPYIVGGHTASGYWVDTDRATTVKGLFAAGDVAGGAPQKYVTGAMVEGEIAARAAAVYAKGAAMPKADEAATKRRIAEIKYHYAADAADIGITAETLEEAMQKTMDEYAGGIHTDYRYNAARLLVADARIKALQTEAKGLPARDPFELLHVYELKERLTVCRALIAHLAARKETRWHIFGENADYPARDAAWDCYVNTRLVDGRFEVITRPLVKGDRYEH